MADFGVSFVPTDNNNPLNRQTGQNGGVTGGPPSPLQSAIQLLSLRLPHVMGAQGIAPGPLLNSPGGAGLADVLRQLFGQGHLAGGGGGLMPPTANPRLDFPMPRIIPAQQPGVSPTPPAGPALGNDFGPQSAPRPAPVPQHQAEPDWMNQMFGRGY